MQLLGNIKLPCVEATIRATPKNRNGTVAAAVASHLVNNCLIRVEWMRLGRRWDWEGKVRKRKGLSSWCVFNGILLLLLLLRMSFEFPLSLVAF